MGLSCNVWGRHPSRPAHGDASCTARRMTRGHLRMTERGSCALPGGSGGRHGSDTLGRYYAGRMIHVVWRHAVGKVGPTERSPILKYWQCGPAPQPPACSSEGCSLQTEAIASFVAGARGPAAPAAEAAAAKRSAALSAIVILLDISWVPCVCVLASCRFSSGSCEGLHVVADLAVRLSGPMRACTTAIASIAHRYFQFGVTARTDGSEPEA